MEKIILKPTKVRAYGNIVETKSGSDFDEYHAILEVSEDTVNGETVTVFEISPEDLIISLVLSSDVDTCNVNDTVNFTVTATINDEPLSDVGIQFWYGSAYRTITTDSNGIATTTYTATTAGTVNFRAVYGSHQSNVVSVVVEDGLLFYDACSSDNTSQYTNFYEIWGAQTTVNTSVTFDTDHYVLSNTNSSFSTMCLPVSGGLDNWKLTAKIKLLTNSGDKGGGVGVATQKEKGIALYQPNGTSKHLILNNYAGSVASNVAVSNLSTSDYNNFELTKNENTLVWTVYDANNTQRFTKTVTISESTYYPNCIPCISVGKSDSVHIKEIKLEAL